MNQVDVENKVSSQYTDVDDDDDDDQVVMLSGGAGGLGRALADLVLARGGHVFVCDLGPEDVTRLVEDMRVKHKGARVEGGQLDVRSGDSWETAWQVERVIIS